MVSIESRKPSAIHGQDKVTVAGGKYKAGPFHSEKGLADGEYMASVTMPIPNVQPAPV